MRIDKVLWFLRFAKSRSIAQAMAETGHIRCNGRRIDRAHQKITVGDVLVLPLPAGVRAIEVVTLPARRGPASEAQGCYRTLDEARVNPLAPAPTEPFVEGDTPP
jgi:ribosome-associated heat shock protein Hsp15